MNSRNPRGSLTLITIGLGDLGGSERFEVTGILLRAFAEGIDMGWLRTGADAGERQRQPSLRTMQPDLKRRIGPHGQPDPMRAFDSEMLKHRQPIVPEV